MQFSTHRKKKALINITSLIDVLFLLLIFVMVSSTFLEQPGIKLDLPEAKSAAIVEQKDYMLYLNREGKLYLNNTDISLDQLAGTLKEHLPKMKDESLILKADQDVSHGLVVQLMDIIKNSGVKKLVIGTQLKKEK
jgi:biopolymer transport protein ExbD